MSELKVYRDPKDGPAYREFYEKSDVDKLIADLKKIHDEEIGRLRAELEYSTFKPDVAKVIANKDKVIRRLSKALYKAIANWAHHRVFVRFNSNEKAWENVERKCLAKVEEYK